MLPSRQLFVRTLPWLISLVLVAFLTVLMLLAKGGNFVKEESVTVRKVDIILPPPPEPPDPMKKPKPDSQTQNPAIDLIGPGEGPVLDYEDNPKLSMLNLEKIDKLDFDPSSLNLTKALSLDFPLLEVKDLDRIPRLVSTNRISFPRELRQRGITEIATVVEIIIDQSGQAYVKKIVDPVYPEMIEIIRKAINDSRFTVPTKNGRPVQAVYLYTLKFIYRS